MVYDASAKESGSQPSLNDCLHPGPPLQNLLWDVLVRSRFHPILLTGDLKQAFLKIRIKAEDRDSLRFHWKETGNDAIQIYRFTRALFGLTCSPFLLGGVLKHHLDAWEDRYPEIVIDLHLPKTNTNKGKQRPSYQASKDFNNLEPDIRNANSLYKFKALLKNAV